MKSIFVFIYALVFGSFYTVFAFDQSMRAVSGRSRCDCCGENLTVTQLVPVLSYIALKGRCGSCQQVISPIYPLAEITTAVVTTYFFIQHGWSQLFLFYFSLFSLLIMLTLSDLYTYRVPNRLLILFTPILLVLSPITWLESFLGLSISLLVFLISFVFSAKIGMGDVKLLLLMGLVLGYQTNLLIVCLASLLGIIYFFFSKADRLPFVPFISLASFMILLIQPYFYITGFSIV